MGGILPQSPKTSGRYELSELPGERPFGAVFPKGEYDERRRKVKEAMAERGIDLLYVSSPRNINYLTGFDIIWFYHASPTGLVIQADSEKVLFFDSYHKRMVNEFSYIDEAVFYATFPFHPTGPQLNTVIDEMKDRGLLKGTIGIEKWAFAPSPAMMQMMEERMLQAGAKVVDGSKSGSCSRISGRISEMSQAPEPIAFRKVSTCCRLT